MQKIGPLNFYYYSFEGSFLLVAQQANIITTYVCISQLLALKLLIRKFIGRVCLLDSKVAWRVPTELFTILEAQNLATDEIYLVWKLQSIDFEITKS